MPFVSLSIPPKIRFDGQNGGNLNLNDMLKIEKNSSIKPTLGFTQFDILQKYRQSFECSELGRLYSVLPLSELARSMNLEETSLGRKSYFSAEGK